MKINVNIPYKNKAYETFSEITKVLSDYSPYILYKYIDSVEDMVCFYINKSKYLHILKVEQNPYIVGRYVISDHTLTSINTWRFSGVFICEEIGGYKNYVDACKVLRDMCGANIKNYPYLKCCRKAV